MFVKKAVLSLTVILMCVMLSLGYVLSSMELNVSAAENVVASQICGAAGEAKEARSLAMPMSMSSGGADYEHSGLGYAINAVKSEPMDLSQIKDGSPVFNSTWLNNQINNANHVNMLQTKVNTYTASDFSEISSSISEKFNFNSSISASAKLFQLGVSAGFNTNSSISYSDYTSQYYYIFNMDYQQYSLSLPNYASLTSDYISNLNPTYIDALDELFETNDYVDFFDTYGTHVIGKGIYGGSLYLCYSALSNKYEFTDSVTSALSSSLTNEINGVIDSNTNFNYNLTEALGFRSSNVTECMSVTAKGGEQFSGTSLSNFNSNYEDWSSTLEDNPVLMSVSSDGLIPLWELLPSQYASKETTLKNWFNSYYNSYKSDVVSEYTCDDPVEFGDYEHVYTVSPQKLVTDSDDTYIDDSFSNLPLDYIDLLVAGYYYMTVSVQFEAWEEDDGYQQISINPTKSTGAIEDDLQCIQFELLTGKKQTSPTTKSFEFNTFEILDFVNNRELSLSLRFGAHGDGDDDWRFRNLEVTVTFSR